VARIQIDIVPAPLRIRGDLWRVQRRSMSVAVRIDLERTTRQKLIPFPSSLPSQESKEEEEPVSFAVVGVAFFPCIFWVRGVRHSAQPVLVVWDRPMEEVIDRCVSC